MARSLKMFTTERPKRPVSERTTLLREFRQTEAWQVLKDEMYDFIKEREASLPVSGAIPELIRFTVGSIVGKVLDEFVQQVESK